MRKTRKQAHYLQICLAIIAILIFTQCKKTEESLINESSIKIDNSYKTFDSLLTNAPHGWKMLVYPDIKKYKSNKGGFAFFMKFENNGQVVKMLSDFNKDMGSVVKESKYSLKFTSLTSLSFSTYNYINYIADPNTMQNGGEQLGWGNRVDIEYSYLSKSANSDTLYLKGNLQNSRAVLIKATSAEEKYLYTEHQYTDLKDRFAAATRGKVGLHVKHGNDLSVMTLALGQRQITFAKDISADSVYIHRTGIAYNGIHSMLLDVPYSYNGLTVKELILENGSLKAKDISGKDVEIVEMEFPVIPAFKMMRTGAYSSIKVPFDNTLYISGFVSDTREWPNISETNDFLTKVYASDINIIFAVFLNVIRFYEFDMQFKSAQKRFVLNINTGIHDSERAGVPPASAALDDSYYNKFSFPYQYRYTYNQNDVFTAYYEGPQFVYAAQFPTLKNAFKSSLAEGDCSLKYTKSQTELLIAFYNKKTGKVIFEGRPY